MSQEKHEFFNIQLDVWIDEEEYQHIYNNIDLVGELQSRVDEFFKNEPPKADGFNKLLAKVSPITSIKIDGKNEEVINEWQPLFWAKYLRARIMEDGSDDATKLLDDLVMYLQRKLPPPDKNNLLLQHLYLQELSACGKPGIESLGFALQAENILEKIKAHPSLKLYRLWAKLNQGMGYAHSKQMMDALQAYDEIIKGFPKIKKFPKNSKSNWQSLICDQAVLYKAEVLEELQFSYHTLTTLQACEDRKKERRLIKEALAYRDMCRLDEAKSKMGELWGEFGSVDEAFETYNAWQIKTNKKNIASQAFGLLIDYYLMKFEEKKDEEEKNEEEVIQFTEGLKRYIQKPPKRTKISSKIRPHKR